MNIWWEIEISFDRIWLLKKNIIILVKRVYIKRFIYEHQNETEQLSFLEAIESKITIILSRGFS